MRRASLREQYGDSVMEVELWHGTDCSALSKLLQHGLQPPSDTAPSDSCPSSGRLHTTLCSTACNLCCEPHEWNRCHMYGLGVYLADIAVKSHAYVRPVNEEGEKKYSLLRCRVLLGNPYCIEGDKKHRNSLHDYCQCQNPRAEMESPPQSWIPWASHDSFVVRGSSKRRGYGTNYNEYIVFHPYQILPLYRVDYVLEG